MAALIDRQKTGQGKKIDCSLLASQVYGREGINRLIVGGKHQTH